MKLLFIDNDSQQNSNSWGDLDYVKDFLEENNILSFFNNQIESLYNFSSVSKEDALKILFDKENIICTWSVYSSGFPYSYSQLMSFLKAAGRNEIKNKVYIDGTGEIVQALNSVYRRDEKNILQLLNAIETNFILTKVKFKIHRVRVQFIGLYEPLIRTEEFDLVEHLKMKTSKDEAEV